MKILKTAFPLLVLALHGHRAVAQDLIPLGDELQVTPTTTTTWFSNYPGVAVTTGGDFLVVWQRVVPPGPEVDIFGRLYFADGSPQGDELQINTYTTDTQFRPRAVGLPDGGFVVVWNSHADSSGTSIQAQLLASDGSKVGEELLVNTYTTGDQLEPAVAAAADGRFVVAWQSSGSGIRAQRFEADGSPLDDELQVDSHTTFNATDPVVAAAADGDFVVAWTSDGSNGSDTSFTSIQGQRFSASGAPTGDQFQVNTYTTDEQVRPSIATVAAGGFAVVWQTPNYGASRTIRGRRFDADGTPAATDFQIDSLGGAPRRSEIASRPHGDFMVVWTSDVSSGNDSSFHSIQGRFYDPGGSPTDDQFQINTTTSGRQYLSTVGSDASGHFIVAWTDYDILGDQTVTVHGQRFVTSEIFADGFESGDTSGWSDVAGR